jgi:DTW domain-containing protein YfiP
MEACAECRKPITVCVCDRSPRLPVNARVLVLQHPQEQDRLLGTVPILEKMVGATRHVGLSWPNLAAALGEELAAQPVQWGVVWPNQLPRELTAEERQAPVVQLGSRALSGIVLLDGSWSQAKTLWWRNPWLLKLDRLVLNPRQPSIYGRLRREPRPEWISTLEAAAQALVFLGEPESVQAELSRVMRTLVQRARDAGPPPETA